MAVRARDKRAKAQTKTKRGAPVLLALLDRYFPATQPRIGARVFDFGCGFGVWLNSFQDRGWITSGLEPSTDVAFVRHERLTSIPADARFDLVIVWHVLEHLPRPLDTLRALAAALAPGGFCLVSVPRVDTLAVHGDLAVHSSTTRSRRRLYGGLPSWIDGIVRPRHGDGASRAGRRLFEGGAAPAATARSEGTTVRRRSVSKCRVDDGSGRGGGAAAQPGARNSWHEQRAQRSERCEAPSVISCFSRPKRTPGVWQGRLQHAYRFHGWCDSKLEDVAFQLRRFRVIRDVRTMGADRVQEYQDSIGSKRNLTDLPASGGIDPVRSGALCFFISVDPVDLGSPALAVVSAREVEDAGKESPFGIAVGEESDTRDVEGECDRWNSGTLPIPAAPPANSA